MKRKERSEIKGKWSSKTFILKFLGTRFIHSRSSWAQMYYFSTASAVEVVEVLGRLEGRLQLLMQPWPRLRPPWRHQCQLPRPLSHLTTTQPHFRQRRQPLTTTPQAKYVFQIVETWAPFIWNGQNSLTWIKVAIWRISIDFGAISIGFSRAAFMLTSIKSKLMQTQL